jgi:T5SS/PEP-CTERM-associated repeat protein/autotransporter-associated beta strand protein
MKSNPRAANALVCMTVAFNAGSGAFADVWDNSSGNSLWSTATNWSDNTEPTINDAVVFPSVIPGGMRTITLAINEVSSSLTFNHDYTLTAGSLLVTTGSINVAGARTATIDTSLGGGAGLTKSGLGTLRLLRTNSFSGPISIGGINSHLYVRSNGALGFSGNPIDINIGHLQLDGVTNPLFLMSRVITPGASGGTVELLNNANLDLNAGLGVNANQLTFRGQGTVVLQQPSNRTGATVLNGVTAQLRVARGLGNPGSASLTNSARLELANSLTYTGVVTLNDTTSLRGAGGTVTFDGVCTASSVNPTTVYLGGGPQAADTLIMGAANADVFRGGASSTRAVVNDAGTVQFNTANSYAGMWEVQSGTLRVNHPGALGPGASPILVTGAGELEVGSGALNRSVIVDDGIVQFTTDLLLTEDLTISSGVGTVQGFGQDLLLENMTLSASDSAVPISVGSSNGHIGHTAGASATATLSGAGWHSGGFSVGYEGSGDLAVSAGGLISTGVAHIGSAAGSSGVATLTGPVTAWINSGFLGVGYAGTGTLVIQSGASVTTNNTFVGTEPGSTGTVNVSDSNSVWGITGTPVIGEHGVGQLTISSGGLVANASAIIGNFADGAGTVTVSDSGSQWLCDGTLSIGFRGAGTLMVNNGGTLSSGIAHIGSLGGSTGAATVTGADSDWTISGFLGVGYTGTGTLNIENGGEVTAESGFVAADPGSQGHVSVTGASSTWAVAGSPVIGEHGVGSLTICAGGTVSGNGGFVGRSSDGVGDATVTGAGSLWSSSGNLLVADGGTGSLVIEAGGRVTSGGYCMVGQGNGSDGRIVVEGPNSHLACADLYVGAQGAGELQVLSGGRVTNTNGSIADNATGAAVVSGVGSTWENSADLDIGNGGAGTLTIEDGGSVDNTIGYVGRFIGGDGNATVSGTGSLWTNRNALVVGYLGGHGSFSILAGGEVNCAQASIGNSDGTGSATVDGSGSTWNVQGTLGLGFNGTGTLQLTNGASVSGLHGSLGFGSGASATVTITGATSTLSCGAVGITMGDGGASSALNLLGGVVTVGGDITDGGAGISTLILDGATLDMQNHAIGGASPIDNLSFRSGTLKNVSQINSGAGLTKTGPDTLYLNTPNTYTGPTTVDQGTLFVVNTSGSSTGTGPIRVSAAATLAGPGRIGGPVQNDGFTAPAGLIGNAMGTLTLLTSYTQSAGGSLVIEIGGTAAHDHLAITGAASLAGTLNVALINGFVPAPGDALDILTAGSVGGTFGTTNLPTLPSPLTWQLEYQPTAVRLVVSSCNLPADTDSDNDVDLVDLTTLLAHFGMQAGATRADGDVSGDGAIDLSDLTLLLASFGSTC